MFRPCLYEVHVHLLRNRSLRVCRRGVGDEASQEPLRQVRLLPGLASSSKTCSSSWPSSTAMRSQVTVMQKSCAVSARGGTNWRRSRSTAMTSRLKRRGQLELGLELGAAPTPRCAV